MQIVPVSAELDFSNRLLYAPSYDFLFSTDATDDISFLNWVAKESKVSLEVAIQQRNMFVDFFNQSLATKKEFTWFNWGVFSLSNSEKLRFVPESSNKTLLTAVLAERIIRKGAEHSVRVGEDERTSVEMEEFLHGDVKKKKPLWLLNALLLLSIGIIFALYFATNYNILWNKHTNSQLIQPKDPPVLYKKH